MAKKMNALNFAQEMGGHAEVTNRRSVLQVAPYLLPIHSQTRIQPPKRRMEIAIEVKTSAEAPSPVKITHTVL
jgi:hypothetical protein